MSNVLCSTGALIGKPNHRNYRLLKPLSEKLCCDGFEFMMYSTWYEEAEQLVDALQNMHLNFPVMHCEKHIGQTVSTGEEEDWERAFSLFRVNCQIARQIGAEKLVLHLWDGEISDSHFHSNLLAYRTLRDMADEQGLDLLIENVVCNREDPMKHWCELAERYPDVHFVFDTKMAAFHGQEEWLYQPEYDWLWREGHIRHFHVNDYGGGYMDWSRLRTLPIGEGHIDFEKFFSFVKGMEYEGYFTVEATAFGPDGTVDVDMLNRCFEKINIWR